MEGPEPRGKNTKPVLSLMFVWTVAGLTITCVTNLPSDLKSHCIDHPNINLFYKFWEIAFYDSYLVGFMIFFSIKECRCEFCKYTVSTL